uniref:YtxH domain-containing protein n=1 Tax=Strongyloides papillosus TaxID=174720 RepID=A0A0N5B576_STREA
MGILSSLLSFSIGAYGGIFISQNYNIPNLPSPDQLKKMSIEVYQNFNSDYLEKFRKDKITEEDKEKFPKQNKTD